MLIDMDYDARAKVLDERLPEVDHLSGPTVVRLMHAKGRTIREVADAMDITLQRVREVRAGGVRGECYAMDWAQGITGEPRLSWADVARLYLGPGRRDMPTPTPPQTLKGLQPHERP